MMLDIVTQYLGIYGGFNPFSTLDFFTVVKGIITFYFFSYFSYRGSVENPNEATLYIVVPCSIAALFMAIFQFPALFIGFIYFGIYYLRFWELNSLTWFEFTRFFIYVTILIAFLLFLDPTIGQLWVYGLIFTSYIQSEIRLREKRKKSAKKEETKK